MTHIGEKSGLRAIKLGQSRSALSCLLECPSIGNSGCYLRNCKLQKILVGAV